MFGLKREPKVESVGLLVTGNNKGLTKVFVFISVSPEPLFPHKQEFSGRYLMFCMIANSISTVTEPHLTQLRRCPSPSSYAKPENGLQKNWLQSRKFY